MGNILFNVSFYLVLACTFLAICLSWVYFRRYQIKQPPVGLLNLVVGTVSLIYFVLEPMLAAPRTIWLITLALAAAAVMAALVFGSASPAFFAVNNLVMAVKLE